MIGIFAVLTALVSAGYDLSARAIQRNKDRSWSIGFLGSWVGTLVLLPFCFSALPPFTTENLLLFSLQGALWSLAVFLEFKSMVLSDAVSNVLISSIRALLLALVGWFVFGEQWSLLKYLGAFLLTMGVLYAVAPDLRERPKGLFIRGWSVLAGAGAIVCDKLLIQSVGFSWALLTAYFVPGVFFLLVRPRSWREELSGFDRITIRPFLLCIFFFVATGPVMLASFGFGELSSTFVIAQSKIVLVLILGVLVLNEGDNLARRWIGGVLTLFGVGLMV